MPLPKSPTRDFIRGVSKEEVPVDGAKLGTDNGTIKALREFLNYDKKNKGKSRRRSLLPMTDDFDAQVIRALQVYLNKGAA